MLVSSFSAITWEAETGRLYSFEALVYKGKFQDGQGYREKPCPPKTKEKRLILTQA